MRFLAGQIIQVLVAIYSIGACRLLSMTFKTFSRSITIKNSKLAAILIAHKNTWGISTSIEKRNKMSFLGIFSYIMFFPQIVFFIYNWWAYFTMGMTEKCYAEETYLAVVGLYYVIAVSMKITEADRFNKGKIW